MDTTVLEEYAAMFFRIDTTINVNAPYLRTYVCFCIYLKHGSLNICESKEILLIEVVEKNETNVLHNILFLICYGEKKKKLVL
jgi:hypothetical protein